MRNNALLFGQPGHIGWGGNSGFQALNLALQWGARRVALCGFDFTMTRGVHWHGRHPPGLNNPNVMGLERWRITLDAQAPLLAKRGVEVIVATNHSALTEYARVPLMELLDGLRPAGD